MHLDDHVEDDVADRVKVKVARSTPTAPPMINIKNWIQLATKLKVSKK